MSDQTESVKTATAPVGGTGPYKFLDYFVEDDKARFAGRERDITELAARVMTDRVSVLYGRSGLGKTSLLLAGVFPELRTRGIQPVYARILASPLQDACRALAATLNLKCDIGPDGLLECMNALSPPPRVLLVLDQFEEFFIRFKEQTPEKKAFGGWLARMTGASPMDFRALFSLREDYLSRLDEFKDDLPEMFGNEYRLRSLTAFGARQAIGRPLLDAGIDFDQRLVSRIVDTLAAEGFDSLLLQIICSAIYREAVARGGDHVRLGERDLESVGGLEGILRRYLDAATQTVEPEHLLLCRTILDALITPQGTKRAVTLEELLQADFNATKEEVETLLGSLEKWRLVRKEVRGRQVWYELTHERLVRHILDWFKLDRTFVDFRVARDLIEVSSKGEMFREKPKVLLVQGQIEDVIGPFRERLRLNAVQKEFMFWSTVYRQTPSVSYWAKALGEEKSREALETMLKHKDEVARNGAAAAAKEIADPNGVLAKECLNLALNDPAEAVRRSAGQSLAVLAGPEEIQMLRVAAKARATRKVAREVLADICISGRDLEAFSFVSRVRAGRIAKRRLLKLHEETIRNRARVGRNTGLIAGLIWVCSVGFCVTVVFSWMLGEIPLWGVIPPLDYILYWGWSILSVVAFAIYLGWQGAKRAARRAALRGEKVDNFYSIGPKRILFLILLALGGLSLAVTRHFTSFLYVVGIFLVSYTVLRFCFWGLLSLCRYSVWPRTSQADIWIWGFLQCVGFPLLIPGVLSLIVMKSIHQGSKANDWLALLPSAGLLTGSLLSLTSLVLLVALARGSLQFPLGKSAPENPVSRRLSHAWGGLGLLSLICWLAFAPASSPFMARTVIAGKLPSASGGKDAITEIAATWPHSRYFRFQVDDAPGQWFHVVSAPPSATLHFRTDESDHELELDRDVYLFVPKGKDLVSLSVNRLAPSAEGRNLKIETVNEYRESPSLDLAGTNSYQYLTFKPDQNESTWSVHLTGALKEGSFKPDGVLQISFLKSIPSGTPQESGGTISALGNGHRFCSLRSVTPVEVPLSLMGFSSASVESYAASFRSSTENWLEIPVNDSGRFDALLKFAEENMEGRGESSPASLRALLAKPGPAGLTGDFRLIAFLEWTPSKIAIDQRMIDLLKKRQFKKAVELGRDWEDSMKYDDCFQNSMAWGLVNTGQYANALTPAKEAVRLHRESWENQDTLAHAAYGAKDWSTAAKAWEDAVKIKPDFFASAPRTDPLCRTDKEHYDEAKRHAGNP